MDPKTRLPGCGTPPDNNTPLIPPALLRPASGTLAAASMRPVVGSRLLSSRQPCTPSLPASRRCPDHE